MMDRSGRDPGDDRMGAWWLVLLLPALCCGLPLLLSAGGTGAILWVKGYGYAALGVLAAGLGLWGLTRTRRSNAGQRCAQVIRRVDPPRAVEPAQRAEGER